VDLAETEEAMPKKKKTDKPSELADETLDEVAAGASGLPTGKRQHKPLSLTRATTESSADGGGGTATITYTGLE
jgi:hypothetical protein